MSRLNISCNSKIQILYTLTYILKNSSFINFQNWMFKKLFFYKSLNASQTHAILVNIWNNLSLKYSFLIIYNQQSSYRKILLSKSILNHIEWQVQCLVSSRSFFLAITRGFLKSIFCKERRIWSKIWIKYKW